MNDNSKHLPDTKRRNIRLLQPGERRRHHAHNSGAPLAMKRRLSLAELSEQRVQDYMRLAGEATQTVMPRDGRYILIIASPPGRVDWVTTLPDSAAAAVLRDLAQHIDHLVAQGWTPVEESQDGAKTEG